MFTKEYFETNLSVRSILINKLQNKYLKIGRFLNYKTIDELVSKILEADFELIKRLPKSKSLLYKTSDLGYGYPSYLTIDMLQFYMDIYKIKKDIPIEFKYECRCGNVFTTISTDDFDIKSILTDDIYFFVLENTLDIYCIDIGKPSLPNLLYFKENLTGFKTTLNKAKTIKGFNRINIKENILILDDIPF